MWGAILIRKFKNEVVWIILVSVLFAFVFGVMSMQVDKDGNMTTCPFMNEASLCEMGTFEHISTFQALFIFTPGKIISIFLISIALLVLSLFAFAWHWLKLFAEKTKILKDYFARNFYTPLLLSPVRRALSQGIIHPKIYELATL